MIIRIIVPDNNQAERSYILSVLFTDFLGVKYQVEFDDEVENYNIVIEGKTLIIKDDFFGKYKTALSYLHLENIPQNLSWFEAKPFQEISLPIIYGENTLKIEEDTVFCGLDIFASAFFMLSRWEEIVIPKKDIHGRCDENEMFVVKHNLYKRAIVNEYVELLKSAMIYLLPNITFKYRKFEVLLTHDIDDLFRYASPLNLLKNLAGDLLHRKSLSLFFKTCQQYISYRRGKIKDPFDTFDEFMDLSDSIESKSEFYFKPSLYKEFDATYSIFDKRVRTIMEHIQNRGHKIGIHPSKNTFHNAKQLAIEIERLRSLGFPIKGGRQHFLLYDVAETFEYWESVNLEYDAGLGFYARSGFRSGTCYSFPMFDIGKRKVLNLLQKPLIVMEGTLMGKEISPEKLFKDIVNLIEVVKIYKGLFVFLWHNDNWAREETKKYKQIYLDIINYLKKRTIVISRSRAKTQF